jgi:hypothetical protein
MGNEGVVQPLIREFKTHRKVDIANDSKATPP